MPDVVIVGGGVIGCAIAYELATSGAAVTLLERGNIAAEASGAAAGIMAPRVHANQPTLAEFALRSLQQFPALATRLRDETGLDVELSRSGVLDLAHDEATARELQERVRQQREIGHHDIAWLDPPEALELEPGLNPGILGAYYDPEGYHVHPSQLTSALGKAAEARGAVIRVDAEVTGVDGSAPRLTAVRTRDQVFTADEIVVCTGSWVSPWESWLGASLPVFPVKGQILSLAPSTPILRTIVWDPDAYLLPRVDGTVVVGATVEQVGFDKQVTVRGLSWLLNAIPSLCPSLVDARFERAWAGLRPASADGLPIVGRLPGWENVTVATGHYRNGITLAPATGTAVAHLLMRGERDALLAPFSPARFQL